jgi:hypothetical protein
MLGAFVPISFIIPAARPGEVAGHALGILIRQDDRVEARAQSAALDIGVSDRLEPNLYARGHLVQPRRCFRRRPVSADAGAAERPRAVGGRARGGRTQSKVARNRVDDP